MNIGFDAKRIFHNRTGLGNYSRDIVRILSDKFPENEYFLYNPKKSEKGYFRWTRENIHEVLPTGSLYKKLGGFWRLFGIKKDLVRDQIELYHGLSGEIPVGLRNFNIPVLVTVHDLIFLRYPHFYSYIDYKIHSYKAKYAVNHADYIIAVSEQTKQDIIAFYKIHPDKIQVIYQGCQDVFRVNFSSEDIDKVRNKYQLPTDYILNVGTIEERKNILTGVKAIKDKEIHLVIVGSETEYTKKVKEFIAQNKMEHQVSFLKGVSSDELAMLYQGARLFIYPSLFEGFGIPIIEALFSNTPVISSTGGCFSEAGGPDCIYVSPESVEELQCAIERILRDSDLAKKMVLNGRKYANRFNPENIAQAYHQVYNRFIK